MKILIAADIFPPQSGGPATYVVALANEFIKQGIEVKIVSLNPNSDENKVSSPLVRVKCKNKVLRYFHYLWLLYKHAKDVDFIYAMGPVNAGLPTCLVAWLRRKKFAVKVVGDYAWEQGMQRFGVKELIDDFQKKKGYGFFIWLLREVEKGVVKRADKVIVPSEYLKGIVEGWGAEPDNIKVIYNAVEFKDLVPAKRPHNMKWIVSVGRLVPWKGMDTLIEVMPNLLEKHSNLRLKIIGDGPVIEDLRFKIKDLNLDKSVELLGSLPHEQTLSYMGAANVFVLNSAYEGLSHVILEAISYGVPVVASRVGGNPELVLTNNRGFLFDYDDEDKIKEQVLKVLNNEKHIISVLSDKEREEFLNKFSFERMINNTKKMLEEVCGS